MFLVIGGRGSVWRKSLELHSRLHCCQVRLLKDVWGISRLIFSPSCSCDRCVFIVCVWVGKTSIRDCFRDYDIPSQEDKTEVIISSTIVIEWMIHVIGNPNFLFPIILSASIMISQVNLKHVRKNRGKSSTVKCAVSSGENNSGIQQCSTTLSDSLWETL